MDKKFFTRFSSSSVSSDTGEMLNNIALMQTGEALGHYMSIDRKSLETVIASIENGKLKSFVNHSYCPDPTDILGIFSGFSIVDMEDGNSKLVAEKFEFLSSADADAKARIIELAQKAPEVFGCSLTADCSSVWVMPDGSEEAVYERPQGCEAISRVARFGTIYSCDFVSDPACNPNGLFSQKQKSTKEQQMKKQMEYFAKRFANKPQLFANAYSKLQAFAEGDEVDEKKIADEVESDANLEETKKENESLKAKVKELEDKIAEIEKAKETAEADKAKAEKETAELSAKIKTIGGADNFPVDAETTQLSADIEDWNKRMDKAQSTGDIAEIQRLNAEAIAKKFI